MLIKTEDNTPIENISIGSHKKIWFTCEECGIGVLQRYRTYIKQKPKKFCRTCRNKHTANRKDVKIKQSIATKNKWKNLEYRKKTSKSLSIACKKAWDNNPERKKWLSKNNPMKIKEYREKVSLNETTSHEELKEICEKYGHEYLGRERHQKGGVKIKFKCSNGHIQKRGLGDFRDGHWRCGLCPTIQSNGEKEISEYLKFLGLKIIENDRNLIHPKEIDILIFDKKIAIEYCGIYWHSEKMIPNKNYHLNKLNLCEEKGYKLITIFEDEWINKKEIIKSRLKYILGLNTDRIYARKCEIKEIDPISTKRFINRYHVQGYNRSVICLGAFYNDRLVSTMTFIRRNIENKIWEINRFCLGEFNVVGIASRFLKYFQRNYEWNKIITFADRRWSNGNLYEKIGFKRKHLIRPNYWYFNLNEYGINRFHKFSFRRKALEIKLEHFNSELSEWENMKNNGWNRIWDCGNILYIIEK